MKFRSALLSVLLLSWIAGFSQAQTGAHSAAYRSMDQKVQHIQQNAQRPQPDQTPTELTAAELNAYFSEGGVKLPHGLQSVKFSSKPAVVTANARVDFDALTAGRTNANPLLSLFTGVHDVVVVAQASGAGGQGSVRVESMSIDGVNVPRAAMEYFVRHYVTPKYPGVGLDSRFRLPDRIDTAIVGSDRVTLTQK